MRLNTIAPQPGSKKPSHRLGRGIGCGSGKTSGKGHKGQKARSGGYHRINFEGGQMPIQRRLPKLGFRSRKSRELEQVTLSEIAKVNGEEVTLEALKQANIIKDSTKRVKIIASGSIEVAKTIKGLNCTSGAETAITAAGGKVESL